MSAPVIFFCDHSAGFLQRVCNVLRYKLSEPFQPAVVAAVGFARRRRQTARPSIAAPAIAA